MQKTAPSPSGHNRRLLTLHQEQEAHRRELDRRLTALELHVFNRSYPPPEEGLLRAAWPFAEVVANRLINRVASLERTAFPLGTIPVGQVVGARWTVVTDDEGCNCILPPWTPRHLRRKTP